MSDHTRTIPVWGRVGEASRRKTLAEERNEVKRRGASDDDQREEGFPRHPPSGFGAGGKGAKRPGGLGGRRGDGLLSYEINEILSSKYPEQE